MEVAAKQLSHDEARSLTDEVKLDAERLWRKLVELYEGAAHLALGYSSWGAYFEAEFGGSYRRGYELLNAGKVLDVVRNSALEPPQNEAQANELVPLLDEPEQLSETWAEVRELHPEPTAADVRKVVQQRTRGQLSNQRDGSLAWSTPQDLFDELHREFDFALDVCATTETAKCARFFTPEVDGLSQEWRGACWMNPPYGDEIRAWIEKAWHAGQDGATVVCLVPARTDTRWWWSYCRRGDVRFLQGRLKFGNGQNSAPFPSAVVVFPGSGHTMYWERETWPKRSSSSTAA